MFTSANITGDILLLNKCKNSPNCVNSLYQLDKKHYITPLPFDNKLSLSEHHKIIKNVLNEFKIIKLVKESREKEIIYIKYECTTKWLKYVDDLEILINNSKKEIHFKSSSRVGYYDFNCNKNRVEKIKEKLKKNFIK